MNSIITSLIDSDFSYEGMLLSIGAAYMYETLEDAWALLDGYQPLEANLNYKEMIRNFLVPRP